MFHISSLLEKIKDRHLKGRLEIEQIAKIIERLTGSAKPIHFSKIKINNSKLYLNQHPLIKNQIMLKKKLILEQITKETGKKIIEIV